MKNSLTVLALIVAELFNYIAHIHCICTAYADAETRDTLAAPKKKNSQ